MNVTKVKLIIFFKFFVTFLIKIEKKNYCISLKIISALIDCLIIKRILKYKKIKIVYIFFADQYATSIYF